MLIKESKWIKQHFEQLNLFKNSSVLNIGSQDNKYNKENKHILDNVISPIKQNHIFKNLDIKQGENIDYSGDILNDDFYKKMSGEKFDCILINNVLEHVTNYKLMIERVGTLVKKDGYIVFTGPYDFPNHYDPIDNGFRPTVNEVHKLFPNFELIKGEIVTDYNLIFYMKRNLNYSISLILRTIAPFYKWGKWKKAVLPKFKYLRKKYKITCVILKNKS